MKHILSNWRKKGITNLTFHPEGSRSVSNMVRPIEKRLFSAGHRAVGHLGGYHALYDMEKMKEIIVHSISGMRTIVY